MFVVMCEYDRVPAKNHIMLMLKGSVKAGVGIHFESEFMITELSTPKKIHRAAVWVLRKKSSDCASLENVPIARPTRMALKP